MARPCPSICWRPKLENAVGPFKTDLKIVSPYFVPADTGTEDLVRLRRQGVRIAVLTNSLEATDVAAVHADYAKRRKTLPHAGVILYELRREAADPRGQCSRKGEKPGRHSSVESKLGGSSSAASLHAKTFSADHQRVFIGSFNFDPRSAQLNTEMGFVIESAEMAEQITDAFEDDMIDSAYRVRLRDDGEIEWIEQRGDETVVHATEPGTSFGERLLVRLLSVLPIEWLL